MESNFWAFSSLCLFVFLPLSRCRDERIFSNCRTQETHEFGYKLRLRRWENYLSILLVVYYNPYVIKTLVVEIYISESFEMDGEFANCFKGHERMCMCVLVDFPIFKNLNKQAIRLTNKTLFCSNLF